VDWAVAGLLLGPVLVGCCGQQVRFLSFPLFLFLFCFLFPVFYFLFESDLDSNFICRFLVMLTELRHSAMTITLFFILNKYFIFDYISYLWFIQNSK
jgi:Zn-dependent protease